MLDWDNMAALRSALASDIGRRTAADATENLARYTTFRALILPLDSA
ncbi:hypothetical protein [Nocardia colli]|nr:hypothetical protein [Nocardia colli]